MLDRFRLIRKVTLDIDFWHRRWHDHNIGFHEGQPNALLVRHLARLSLEEGNRLFLPLCGKTHDIAFLLSQGFSVVGVELSAIAIDELFEELGTQPKVDEYSSFRHYSAPNIEVFVGDFFDLDTPLLGKIDAVFDRAALVALPLQMRQAYSQKLQLLSPLAKQLLIVFDYHQTLLNGPPFSISRSEVLAHYGDNYQCLELEQQDCSALFGNKLEVAERAYLLEPKINPN